MKAVEERLQDFILKQPCGDITSLGRGYRAGWKAALEQVLKNKRFCRECDFNIDADIIEKELEEE